MPTGAHPHIACDLEIEMAQALGRDEAAVCRTAGEMGASWAEQDPLDVEWMPSAPTSASTRTDFPFSNSASTASP